MSFDEWLKRAWEYGVRPDVSKNEHGGLRLYFATYFADRQVYQDLWHLDDYKVSSVIGPDVYLCPVKKVS